MGLLFYSAYYFYSGITKPFITTASHKNLPLPTLLPCPNIVSVSILPLLQASGELSPLLFGFAEIL